MTVAPLIAATCGKYISHCGLGKSRARICSDSAQRWLSLGRRVVRAVARKLDGREEVHFPSGQNRTEQAQVNFV